MSSTCQFSRAQYDALREALRRLPEVESLIRDAEACGVQCDGYRSYLDYARTTLTEIERRFMPAPPQR